MIKISAFFSFGVKAVFDVHGDEHLAMIRKQSVVRSENRKMKTSYRGNGIRMVVDSTGLAVDKSKSLLEGDDNDIAGREPANADGKAMSRQAYAETMSSVLGSFAQLDFHVQPCSLAGAWRSASGNRSMDFNVDDNKLLLQIGESPQMTVHFKPMQFLIGGQAQQLDSLAEGRLTEVVQASTANDLKSVSDLLGISGASGNMAPSGCFHRLHYALLGMAKLNSKLHSTGTIGLFWDHRRRTPFPTPPPPIPRRRGLPKGYAATDGTKDTPNERRRRGDDSSKCRSAPPVIPGTRKDTRTSAAHPYKNNTGGWFADNYGFPWKCNDSIGFSMSATSINCKQSPSPQPDARHTGFCQGLCGHTCSCWIGLCGSGYHCQYNKMCCEHDYKCADMLSVECLVWEHHKIAWLCKSENKNTPRQLRGPLRKDQGCATSNDNWCQSGRCSRRWSGLLYGWYCS